MNYKPIVIIITSFIIVVILDLSSKMWAEATLQLYYPVPLMGEFLRFTLGYNTGIAFGMFNNAGIWPLLVTGVVIVGLTIWLFSMILTEQWPNHTAWPIGLVLGGAVSNFADRFPDQRVTDFIDVGLGTIRWPTFNIADSFIVVGLFLLVLMTHRLPQSTDTTTEQEEIITPTDLSDKKPVDS